MIHHVARERGAERGADTYCAPYDAKPQVEPSRAAHDVRDDERENHPENGGADAIEGRSTRFIPSPSRHSIPRSHSVATWDAGEPVLPYSPEKPPIHRK